MDSGVTVMPEDVQEDFLFKPFVKLMQENMKLGKIAHGHSDSYVGPPWKMAKRGAYPRAQVEAYREHCEAHWDKYMAGEAHDHLEVVGAHLVAAACNAMMEFYWWYLESWIRATPVSPVEPSEQAS